MKLVLKKFMIPLLVFLYSGITVLSVSLPVGAAPRKVAKKTVRKAGGARKKSNSSSGVKKSSAGVKRQATSKKRTLSGKNSRRAATTGTSRRNSRRVATVRTTIGKSLSFMNQLNDNTTASEQTCINLYVDCMDNQISSTLSKYSFLSDDESVELALETGQPFRCVFYDPNSNVLKSNASALNDDKKTCIGITEESCYTQRGVNELYNSYNYFCDIQRKLKNNIGRKINQCDLSAGSNFATKYSVAYYNEVLKRMSNDGLQMINLESSTIYKNFINQLDLENEDSYVINGKIGSEIFNQLNLEDETELFSINVVPPIGANAYLASAQFNTASNNCLKTEASEVVGTTAQKEAIRARNKQIAQFNSNNCISLKDNLQRYYLSGKWEGVKVDDNGNQIEGGTTEDITSAFFSAKESCGLYEQALISTRDKKYGEFDNQMQNWIEDNLAKMVKKKMKSTASLAAAETNLKKLDNQITNERSKVESEMAMAKLKAEGDAALAESEYNLTLSNVAVQKASSQKELASTFASTYATPALTKCSTMILNSYNTDCGSSGASCFSKDEVKSQFWNWIGNLKAKSVKINREGDVIPSSDSNYDKYIAISNGSADKGKTAGYYQIYCVDIPTFSYKLAFLSNLPGNLETSYGVTVKDQVKKHLEETFPDKSESKENENEGK